MNAADLGKVRVCLALFFMALILRVIGIHYGFWNGDERVNDAAKVLTGQLVPDQHFYPPLFNYIMAAAFSVLYGVGRLIPLWNDTAEFRNQYFADPTPFYLTARFVTACLGAAAAPLFYLISREVGIRRWPAIGAGLVAAMIPVNVMLSHTAKSDVPLATMVVAVFYVMLLTYRSAQKDKMAVLLGLAVSLAFSFKHSFIFLALPLAAWHIYWLARHTEPSAVIRSLALTTAAFMTSWIVFNIGIVLDLGNFLTYQAIQSQMSIRESSSTLTGISTWFSLVNGYGNGITPIGVLLYFAFPVLLLSGSVAIQGPKKHHLLAMWASLLIATIIIIHLTGGRQPPGLWLPAFTGMSLFAALSAVMLISFREGPPKLAGYGCLAALIAWSAVGDGVVLKQALAKPVKAEVTELVRQSYADRNIVTWSELDLPQTRQSQRLEIKRAHRLAEKYQVDLRPLSKENIIKKSAPDAVNYVQGPRVFGGLEHATDESIMGIVRAHTWPLQDNEWSLQYWTKRDFDLFVIANFQRQVGIMREFIGELSQKCRLVSEFETKKPLFVGHDVSVFDCEMETAATGSTQGN